VKGALDELRNRAANIEHMIEIEVGAVVVCVVIVIIVVVVVVAAAVAAVVVVVVIVVVMVFIVAASFSTLSRAAACTHSYAHLYIVQHSDTSRLSIHHAPQER